MEKKQRILVADSSENYRWDMVKAIESEGDISVVAQTEQGEMLLELIVQEAPDLVLMDLNLEGMDGIEVLERLKEMELLHRPKILVVSGFVRDSIAQLVLQLGVDYYLVKPCSVSRICQRIRQLVQGGQPEVTSLTMERMVSEILQSMGMPAHVRGYQYLRWAILSVIDDPELIHGITKILYPMVAKAHHSTPSRVERSIRHAIDMAWLRGDLEVIHRYFGSTVSSSRGRPTNSEFIAMISDHLRLKEKNW